MMFTGLIREVAKVKSFDSNILTVQSSHRPKIGDSIAINGVCLSVISISGSEFCLEVADETRSIIDASKLTGDVHLEPAMQMGDRFEGHIVQGHVDCVGTIGAINQLENATDFIITLKPEHMEYIVPKGSITIDGISLTVNEAFAESFRLTIIPHTLQNTLFKYLKIGDKVNIETDMFARYISHILSHKQKHATSLDWGEIDTMQMSY